jgi:hypothetical protein
MVTRSAIRHSTQASSLSNGVGARFDHDEIGTLAGPPDEIGVEK